MRKFYSFALLLLCFYYTSAQTDENKSIKGICIYIDYSDAPINIPTNQIDSLLNGYNYQETDVNRSFKKYWHQESRRNYLIDHDIFYYTAPLPSSHYAGLQWFDGILLWKEALEHVIATNPNYDWDSLTKWSPEDPYNKETPNFLDGGIKSTIIISSTYGPAGLGGAHYPQWTLSNGELIGTIQGSGLKSSWDPFYNLFVLIHETGHSLFNLPDTYDYDASSGGTAKYSLMSAQGPDVEPIGAPFIYQHNWGYIKEPIAGTQKYTLPADGDTIVVIKNIHDPNEFFAIEARKKSTPGNSLFPVNTGLLIWHSDLKVNNHNTQEQRLRYEHYKHSIEQKDGLYELENSGSGPPINSGDIFLPGDQFDDTTTPDANWWAGEDSGISIYDIEIEGDNISFTVTVDDVHDEHYDFIPKDQWTIVYETPGSFNHDASKAIDDDGQTFYHVPWGSSEPRPHEIIIDLGDYYNISEFYYTANDNYSPPWEGRIRDFEVAVSVDEDEWEYPIIEKYFQTPYRQYSLIDDTPARFIRFLAYSSYFDDQRTSIAELDIRGKLFDPNSSDEFNENNISVGPNPVSDILGIGGLKPKNIVKITNDSGVLLQEKISDKDVLFLDVYNYPDGVLIVSVFNKNGELIKIEKIVKVK